jgi:hypothetical protein
MKLILPIVVENISTRVDGSMKFTLGTQEINPSQAADLFSLRGKYAKVLLSDTHISPMQEEIVDAEVMRDERKAKSPSQRMRAVMYRKWEAERPPVKFEVYYNAEMERLITELKEQLNDLKEV